jgi:hypothetical protein
VRKTDVFASPQQEAKSLLSRAIELDPEIKEVALDAEEFTRQLEKEKAS